MCEIIQTVELLSHALINDKVTTDNTLDTLEPNPS
jgi:hypothetical protein